ncbi:hypothetical protein LWI28_012309 [Acer negundo]|uniref:Uncharacterized protein n=1 Tax=Acer negundo TaxID=4023 RepID=A0AAD5NRB5_ACENE|nr:hypothetical protein LWI28_012309 [Acer negundo]
MKKKSEFEYCKVCKRNHNERQRHKYFPSHTKSLSNFLSRFQNKITDIRFFLKNLSVLSPEHASRNRFWCVFCDFDADELGSSFVCIVLKLGKRWPPLPPLGHFRTEAAAPLKFAEIPASTA